MLPKRVDAFRTNVVPVSTDTVSTDAVSTNTHSLQVFLAWLCVKEGFNRTVDTPGEFTSERATLLVPFTVVWAVLLVRS